MTRKCLVCRTYLSSLFSDPIKTAHILFSAVTLLCHVVTVIRELFAISEGELLYSLLIRVGALFYEPSCPSSFHLANTYIFVAAEIFLQCWKELTIAWRQILQLYHIYYRIIFTKSNITQTCFLTFTFQKI
jgi:hypothetical protein